MVINCRFVSIRKNRLKSVKKGVVQVVPHFQIVNPCRLTHYFSFCLTVDESVDGFATH